MNFSNVFSKAKQNILLFSVVCGSLGNGAAQAIELGNGFGLDVTVTALSDYRDTGISQTKGDPALQAEVVLQHQSGLYVGVFSSNVDAGTKARREDMYYVGATIPFTEEISLDTYVGRYEYPKEANSDFNEFSAVLSGYGFQLGYTYDFDLRSRLPNNLNWSLGYNFELPYESNLLVRYGYSDLKYDAFWSKSEEPRSTYHDWEVKLSKNLFGVNFFASYIDTDLSKTECYSASGYEDVCSATVVFGVSKTF
ncbi:TorF family putative porin [Pseudomonas vanderleydeniana]|uniref:TorF family putative porin n=1 Tax=Pseudomonas vanderleydeniana TaxID=2745495 RepID=A0A9E6PPV7_9PSED|nr:TorF family putative porin [Pseudomonas vanderleydeniana]QXI30907.1 TorF family putative porin [Pseudomonas vanderleydeniana]